MRLEIQNAVYAGCRSIVGISNMENKAVRSYTAIDLETTGLDPKMDKIIEIGAAKIIDGQITDTYSTLVRPGRRLSETVSGLTGITDDMLAGAMETEQAIKEILDFLGNDIILGHGVLFDFSFVKRCAVNHGLSYEASAIDTLRIARRYLSELPSRGLPALCEHYGIRRQSHRALEDALASVELYDRLCDRYYDGSEVFVPQKLVYQVKKEHPATKRQRENLARILCHHGLTADYELEKLTRNEASRYMDQIILQYGRIPEMQKRNRD